jgi:uncharacterized membrane protein YeaQ/YmgE (transglycosylase-associated protein family)
MPEVQTLIIWAIVGIVAGFLAGQIMRGGGFGLVGNLIVGIVGAMIAGWLLPQLGLGFSLVNPLVTSIAYATIGAVILLFLVGLARRAR